MFVLKILPVLILINLSFQEDNTSIFCSKSFCTVYTTQNQCRKIPPACKAQNATDSGIFLLSDGPCNCCKYCLENLHKDEICEKSATQSSPSSICGERLACENTGGKPTCQTIDTDCSKKAADWDKRRLEGHIGHMELRPECDKDGNYISVKCIPGQTCFCQSEDGNRIFGDVPYQANAQMLAKCACSRHNYEANKYFEIENYNFFRPRCLSDGSFDTLQCFNTTCVCVDKNDGTPDVNTRTDITLIAKQNIPCFDQYNHDENYLRNCEKEYKDILDQIDDFIKDGLNFKDVRFPNCQEDGQFGPVQENEKDKYCVHPDGTPLTTPAYKIPKTDSLAETMDCKCARANLLIEGNEKADCLDNGNYNHIQCRRGLCRCVNNDGIQVVINNQIEVDIKDKDKLNCYNK